MKFGIRVPSFKKRVSARTSWRRVARHSLGLKAPRGWGELTNPKKAVYNRVYNRTTVDVFGGKGGGLGGSVGGCGSLLLGLVVLGLFTKLSAVVWSLAVSAVGVCAVIWIFRWNGARKQNAERLRLEAEALDRAATEARLERERALAEERSAAKSATRAWRCASGSRWPRQFGNMNVGRQPRPK